MQQTIERALRFATKQHRGQVRESSRLLPYITHPIEVMTNLILIGAIEDQEMLIAALMHDLLEETETTPKDIKSRFGTKVAALVVELTRVEPQLDPSWSKDRVWLVRADSLLEEVQRMSPDAMTLKLADRLANTREAFRFREGKGLARYVWQSNRILEAIPMSVNPGLWKELYAIANP